MENEAFVVSDGTLACDVNTTQIKIALMLSKKNNIIPSFKRLILDKINPRDIKIRDKELTAEFEEYLKSEWYTKASEILESIMEIGLVPIKVSPRPNNRGFPQINVVTDLIGVFGTIFQKTTLSETTFSWANMDRTLNDGVVVLGNFGNNPNPTNGDLTSIIYSLFTDEIYRKIGMRENVRAMKVIARPPIIYRDELNTKRRRDLYLETEKTRKDNDKIEKVTRQVRTKLQDKIAERIMKKDIVTTGTHPVIGNRYPILGPIDHQVQAQIPTVYTVLNDDMIRQVSLAFAVPKEVLFEGENVTSTSQSHRDQMNDTVKTWKTRLSRVYSDLYLLLFEEVVEFYVVHTLNETYDSLKKKRDDGILLQKEFVDIVRHPYNLETSKADEEKLYNMDIDSGNQPEHPQEKASARQSRDSLDMEVNTAHSGQAATKP